jgi:hypothetical protein
LSSASEGECSFFRFLDWVVSLSLGLDINYVPNHNPSPSVIECKRESDNCNIYFPELQKLWEAVISPDKDSKVLKYMNFV